MADRLKQLTALDEANGITEDDLRAAGNERQFTPEDDVGTQLASEFDDPAVQDEILNPAELDLPSEVPVSDWRCTRGHTTTTYGGRPDKCVRCGDRTFDGPDDRITEERYVLRLAFSDHDVRKRKVWEHVEALRSVFLREMLADNPRAQLDPRWIDRNPGTVMVGYSAVATRNKVREVLRYLADCPYELVEGLSMEALVVATSTLLSTYAAWADRRAKDAATKAGASSVRPNSAPVSSATDGARTT